MTKISKPSDYGVYRTPGKGFWNGIFSMVLYPILSILAVGAVGLTLGAMVAIFKAAYGVFA